jgi:DNA-binding response OmpR family regulator
MQKILIADDNKQITAVLSEYSKREGFEPFIAENGAEAAALFHTQDFDMVLLDVMMPLKDGYEVCREIRQRSNVPIIMITAKGEDYEKIMGLDIGADDYIVKPFSSAEVMARIRALLRRMERTPENDTSHKIFTYDNLTICLDEFSVLIEENELPLTKKEIELLWIMATNQKKLFTRENLLDSVWGYDYFGDSRTVDSHIKRLRAKLDAYSHPNWQIKTVWGKGYKFEVKA